MMAGGTLDGNHYWNPTYNTTYGGTGSGNGMLQFPEDPFNSVQDWTNGFSLYLLLNMNSSAPGGARLLSFKLYGTNTHFVRQSTDRIHFDACGLVEGFAYGIDYNVLFVYKPDGSQEAWKDGVLVQSANADAGRVTRLTDTETVSYTHLTLPTKA